LSIRTDFSVGRFRHPTEQKLLDLAKQVELSRRGSAFGAHATRHHDLAALQSANEGPVLLSITTTALQIA